MVIQIEYICNIIEELPFILKEPFTLHYNGYSYNEIVEAFGISLGAI